MTQELEGKVTELSRRTSQHKHDIDELYLLTSEVNGTVLEISGRLMAVETGLTQVNARLDGHDRKFDQINDKIESVLTLMREGPATA